MGIQLCDSEPKPKTPRKRIQRFPPKAKLNRVRQRGDYSASGTLTAHYVDALDADCLPLAPLVLNVPTATKHERIEDTSGMIQNWWNPCFHEKYEGKIALGDVSYFDGVETATTSFSGDLSLLDFLRNNIPQPPPEIQDDLAAMAENHFVAPVDANGDSIANFFIELFQCVQGNIKALKRYTTLAKKVLAAYNRAYETYLQKGNSRAASMWLAWNFAVKTNISDLKRLLCAAQNARKRFKWLQKRNHKPTEVKYRLQRCWEPGEGFVLLPEFDFLLESYKGHPETCVPGGLSANIPVANPTWLELRLTDYQLDFSATGWVIFDLPDWVFAPELVSVIRNAAGVPSSGTLGTDLLLLQQEGVTNPLKILWNAIPYSWLLDWFVSYRTHLQENLADLGPFENAELIKSGHSWKLRSQWQVILCSDNPSGYHEYNLGSVKYDTYTRKLDLPNPSVLPFRVPWAGYNISIVTALVSQWRTRRR